MNRKERRATAKQQRSASGGSGNVMPKVQQAIDLVNAGDMEQAETILTGLRKSNPNEPEIKHQLGMIFVRTGRSEAGQDLLRQSVEARPEEPLYWNNLAAAYLSVEMSDKAAEAARRATTLNPKYCDAWQNLGLSLRDLKQHAEAVEAFERGDATGQLASFSLGSWGESLGLVGRFADAERVVKRGLETAPDDAALLTLLGWVLVEQKKDEEARGAFRKSLEVNPNQFLAAFNYGILLLRTPDNAGALRWLRRASSIDIKSPAAWRVLALELARSGLNDEALPAAERAARLDPNDDAINRLLRRLKGQEEDAATQVIDFAEPMPIGPSAPGPAEKRGGDDRTPLLDLTTINFGTGDD